MGDEVMNDTGAGRGIGGPAGRAAGGVVAGGLAAGASGRRLPMELLAPAGGPEQLREAIHFGADAVYLAGTRWGMRARADNFDDAGLWQAVSYAHAHGVAVHVTLNTVMYDEDRAALIDYLGFINSLGVDAAIVADLGAMRLLRRHAPHVALHVSTQASVLSAEAAEAYADLGATRVVLGREASLEQIARMRQQLDADGYGDLELEAFAHGSMCMAYSGRCLLSAELMGKGRSASRGACAQPCRWSWELVEARSGVALPGESVGGRAGVGAAAGGAVAGAEVAAKATTGPEAAVHTASYLLSSNDLCMIGHLDDLASAGVASIKLEGRNKGAYYAAAVTNAYRQVLDGADPAPWRAELEHVSHRPYGTGFYYGDPEQNPGSVDYLRDRVLVAVVEACEPAPGGGYSVVAECRNRADAGATLAVLTPGRPVGSMALGSCERWDEDAGAWVPAPEGIVRNGARYRLASPVALMPGDLLCL